MPDVPAWETAFEHALEQRAGAHPRRAAVLAGETGTPNERAVLAAELAWLTRHLPEDRDALVVDLADGLVAVAAARIGLRAVALAPSAAERAAVEAVRAGEPPDVAGRVEILDGDLSTPGPLEPGSASLVAILDQRLDEGRWAAARAALVPDGVVAVAGADPLDLVGSPRSSPPGRAADPQKVADPGEAAALWAVTDLVELANLDERLLLAAQPNGAGPVGSATGAPEVAQVMARALAAGQQALAHVDLRLEQARLDAEDRDWVVADAQRRVAESEQRAKDERRRAKRAKRASQRAEERRAEAAKACKHAERRLTAERDRRKAAEDQVTAMRRRRWWRLGALLGAARREPRRLLRLPVDVLRLVAGREPRG